MRDVEVVVTSTSTVAVGDGREFFERYRPDKLPRVLTHDLRGTPECAMQIEEMEYDIDRYDIIKLVIDNQDKYIALDEPASKLYKGMIEQLRSYDWHLHNGRRELAVKAEEIRCKNTYIKELEHDKDFAWRKYNQDVMRVTKLGFFERMKFLLTGRLV